MAIRVFLADDHEIVTFGLEQLLSAQPDMQVVGKAASSVGLTDALQHSQCDVLILDVNMPGCDTSLVIPKVLALPSAPRIIVYSMYPEDLHAVRFLRAGASAYLNKERGCTTVLEAIRKAYAGGHYITPELADHLFERGIDLTRPPTDLLSDRELAVVRGLAAGQRATEIAADMGVSASTVNTFVYRIKAKLGARTTIEIIRLAEDNGLLG